jgi:excisionase family DNA binding protein
VDTTVKSTAKLAGWLTARRASVLADRPQAAIQKAVRAGELEAVRVGPRLYLIRESSFERWRRKEQERA